MICEFKNDIIASTKNLNSLNQDELNFIQRSKAVRLGKANIALEGLTLDPEVIELNRLFISGELTLDAKLVLIKNLYNDE